MAHIDSHRHLVLHHLHELAESSVFLRVNEMVLIVGCIGATIVISVVDHVRNEAELGQLLVLRH